MEAPGMHLHLRSLRTIIPAAMEPNPSMPSKGSGDAVCGKRPDLEPLLALVLAPVVAAPWSAVDVPVVAAEPLVPWSPVLDDGLVAAVPVFAPPEVLPC